MKRLLVILLVLVMMVGVLAPAAAAENSGSPSREDMRGHGDIAVPKQDSWLSSYETRYVCSSGGVAAFLFRAPKLDMELHFDDVLEGTELTLLAKENDFYLVKLADRRVGWISVGQTAEDRSLLDSVPDLKDGSWILCKGEGDRNCFRIEFGADRSAKLVRVSDGARIRTGWILSGRRLRLEDRYFIWDGEQFVSRDEFTTPQGALHYTVSPEGADK